MKVLIVSALPYDVSSTTRAFETYFNKVEKNDLAQIYTNTSAPSFECCRNFFRITDRELLGRIFNKKKRVGTAFSSGQKNEKKIDKPVKKFFKKDVGLLHFLRLLLWKKNRWYTEELKQWLNKFSPDIIFYHNSNSIFLTNIALHLKNELNIPLVTEISDDYYFIHKHSLSLYRRMYNNKMRHLLKSSDGTIFISEKMQKAYSIFNIKNSNYVHICSKDELTTEFNKPTKFMCYFGNIGLKRYKTLKIFANYIYKSNSKKIDVYCPQLGNSDFRKIKNCKCINFCGSLPYKELINAIMNYRYLLIAEPLDRKTSNFISLSLSTKVSDSLKMGKPIIAVGGKECGTIDFLSLNKCATVINNPREFSKVNDILGNILLEKDLIRRELNVYKNEFSFESNAMKSLNILESALKNYHYEK